MADHPTSPDFSIGANASLDYTNDTTTRAKAESTSVADSLSYTNPDYDANIYQWNKYIDCYSAIDIYKYIFKHIREHDDSWRQRLKRGYYYNYVASIVDLYVAYLFEGAVTRREPRELQEDVQALYKDATRTGMKYDLFMQMAATFAIAAGHTGILVDMPSGGGVMTVEEVKRNKIRPYLSLVQAQQILDWELDDKGQFEWVKIEIPTQQNRTWKKQVDSDTRTFVIWTKYDWEKWQVYLENGENGKQVQKARQIDGGEHPCGEVPLVILKNKNSLLHSWFGESAVRDICDINIAILNWCSFADEEIANRCLNILTMQESGDDSPIELSHYNILTYAEGAERPQYLAPSDTVLKLIGDQIKDARSEIYRLARLSGSTGLLGVREATSGVAYAFEFNETNQSLSAKAQYVEQAELDIHRLYAKWLGKDSQDMSIVYPREFGVDDFLIELQILTEARATLTSEKAIRELEKRVTSKMFSRESQKLRDEIAKEIEQAELRRSSAFSPGTFEEVFANSQFSKAENDKASTDKEEKETEETDKDRTG